MIGILAACTASDGTPDAGPGDTTKYFSCQNVPPAHRLEVLPGAPPTLVLFLDRDSVASFQRSTDLGATWGSPAIVPDGFTVPSPVVTPFVVLAPAGQMWATSKMGLLKSTNLGDAWVPVPAANYSDITGMAAAPDGTLLLVTGNVTFGRSADGGATWATVESNRPVATLGGVLMRTSPSGAFFFTKVQKSMGSGHGGDLYRSVDKGATWARATGDCRDVSFGPGGLAVCPGEREIRLSSDDGATFAKSMPLEATVNSAAFDGSGGLWIGIIKGDFEHFVAHSADRGATWKVYGAANGVPQDHVLSVVPLPEGRIAILTDTVTIDRVLHQQFCVGSGIP